MTEVSRQYPGLVVNAAVRNGKGGQPNMSSTVVGVATNNHHSLTPREEQAFRTFFDDRAAKNPKYRLAQEKVLAEFEQTKPGTWQQKKKGDCSWQTGEAAWRTDTNYGLLLSAIAGFEKAQREGAPTV
jgi:hypothetical protein